MSTAAVSIVIPTYNRAAYLPDAIGSVQRQSISDWELIVVDDGSTDGTLDLLAPLAAADGRIRVVSNRRRCGPAGARNSGIAACRAEWVAFLDSDDRWEADKLACFIEATRSDSQAIAIGSDYWIVDQAAGTRQTMLEFIAGTMLPWWEGDPIVAPAIPWRAIKASPAALAGRGAMIAAAISGFLWLHSSSAMVRRDALIRLGGFDESLRQMEDVDLWLRLAEAGSMVLIARPLATYDRTGQEAAIGSRYAAQHPSRLHTRYLARLCELSVLQRIARRHRLTLAQRFVLLERLVARSRDCAAAAEEGGHWVAGLRHRLVAGALAPVPALWLLALRVRRRLVRPGKG